MTNDMGRDNSSNRRLIIMFAAAAIAALALIYYAFYFKATPAGVEYVALKTPSGVLYGTLDLPQAKTPPLPVVLIIAGSGPTDRDGNSRLLRGKNNSLKLLAKGLTARGVATLRYDKRGVGQSRRAAREESEITFDTMIDDAVRWCRLLRKDRRFDRLIIVGHSEGSLIGMKAAGRVKADGFISIAGMGRPAWAVLLEQLKPKVSPLAMTMIQVIIGQLKKGKMVKDLPVGLELLFRPSVQPYLISLFRYDPARVMAKLECPALIVQGTTDIQVKVKDARALKKADSEAKLVIIDGMNHVLRTVPDDMKRQIASYSDPSLPVTPRLIEVIWAFIGSIRPK